MSPADFLPYLTGPAAAVVVFVWWVFTLRQDIKDLRRALDAERQRADSGQEAARTTLSLLSAITGRPPPGGGGT